MRFIGQCNHMIEFNWGTTPKELYLSITQEEYRNPFSFMGILLLFCWLRGLMEGETEWSLKLVNCISVFTFSDIAPCLIVSAYQIK